MGQRFWRKTRIHPNVHETYCSTHQHSLQSQTTISNNIGGGRRALNCFVEILIGWLSFVCQPPHTRCYSYLKIFVLTNIFCIIWVCNSWLRTLAHRACRTLGYLFVFLILHCLFIHTHVNKNMLPHSLAYLLLYNYLYHEYYFLYNLFHSLLNYLLDVRSQGS